jgi:RNA polymerase sigma-70 factor (ECF subfamily)
MHGAFVALLETIDRLESPASLESYLYGIALNTARRELARRRRWRLLHRAELPEQRVPAKQIGLDARRAVTELHGILNELSPKLRLVFVLRYFEGLELTEVAATLGFSLASTKRYLKKARSLVLARASRDPRLAEYLTHSAGGESDG